MKKRIYLMFEVKKRELEARLYFALVAALKDYSIVVGNKADILGAPPVSFHSSILDMHTTYRAYEPFSYYE